MTDEGVMMEQALRERKLREERKIKEESKNSKDGTETSSTPTACCWTAGTQVIYAHDLVKAFYCECELCALTTTSASRTPS
jgi:hypothetical protein